MKKENNAVNPKSANDPGCAIPMSYCFAEKLIINEIIGEMPEVHMPAVAWVIKKENLVNFIREYLYEHKSLPDGCHDLGSSDRFGSFAEPIDFAAVKQKIHDDMEKKYYLNQDAWHEGRVKSVFRCKRSFIV